MAQLNDRPYRDERDLARMLRMVTRSALATAPDPDYFHPGDVVWGLFQNTTIDPVERIRLFEDGRGALRGFVWLHPPRAFALHIDAASPLSPDEVAAMARAAEARLEPGGTLTTDASCLDNAVRAGLRRAGYRETGSATYQLNAQAIGEAIPEPELPPGVTVRPVNLDDPDEVAARAELHREVWAPSKFTFEGYARLREKPVYRPDLDLVAVTPAGDLAAYCIVWWDPETRTGEFEPVGTSARFRRQGYGRALLLGGLRRLRGLGAERAIVVSGTDAGAEPARRLYEAVGFTPALRFDDWERNPATS